MKSVNNAPVYAGMYMELAEIARSHGYAMAVHGSMARDFDLICVPWIQKPSDPRDVVKSFCELYNVVGPIKATLKEHGRLCYAINFSFADCYLDISFMPTKEN